MLVAVALLLAAAPVALAAAGGGSSGFGGGGGGGGGGGRGIGIAIQLLIRVLIFSHGLGALILLGLIVVATLFYYVAPRAQSFWNAQERTGRASRRRVGQRERRVELAAAEAAEDDPAFAPEAVRQAATRLFTDIQAAWDTADRVHLRGLVASDLLAEWELRLDDFQRKGWRNRVQPLQPPKVEYVGLRRGASGDARVVVRIEAKLRDYVEDRAGKHIRREGSLSETTRTREFWTLAQRDGHWVLFSIEQGAEGSHALGEQIVATPWSDEQALRDEALVEGAVAEAVPEGTAVAEVADLSYEGDAHAAALDLSLADGRFAPDVLEVAARRAVAAWADAVDGNDRALLGLARADAARELLHPGDPSGATRLVVRGLSVRGITITALDAAATPPTMTLDVALAGRRYIEERDTAAVVSGSQSRQVRFAERWLLALDGSDAEPWRIAAVSTPVGRS
jgi:predicted lipid-binding transport protein (Tim44 family)